MCSFGCLGELFFDDTESICREAVSNVLQTPDKFSDIQTLWLWRMTRIPLPHW